MFRAIKRLKFLQGQRSVAMKKDQLMLEGCFKMKKPLESQKSQLLDAGESWEIPNNTDTHINFSCQPGQLVLA